MKPKNAFYIACVAVFALSAWPTLPFVPAPDLTPTWIARDTITAACYHIAVVVLSFFLIRQASKITDSLQILFLGCVPALTLALWHATVFTNPDTLPVYKIFGNALRQFSGTLPSVTVAVVLIRLATLWVAPRLRQAFN